MDKILSSLLLSDKPDSQKRQVIHAIASKGAKSTEDEVLIKSMFKTTSDFILDGENDTAVDLSKKVYFKWAKHHSRALAGFFDVAWGGHLLQGRFRHPANSVWLLHETFLLLQETEQYRRLAQLVQISAVSFVRNHPDDEVLAAFCKLLFKFRECLPPSETISTLCVAIVHAVSGFSAPANPARLPRFIFNVSNVIGTFLRHLWQAAGTKCILHCLEAIFTLISFVDSSGTEPCVALGGLVTHVPDELTEQAVRATVNNASVKDSSMVAALKRVIDWLIWPTAAKVNQWILAFLRELTIARRYSVLITVTEICVEQVYDILHHRPQRERAMSVLSRMLLSFQHSPDAFHKIVHRIPTTVQVISQEDTPDSKNFLDSFCELMHCLMYLHPGFPELYDRVLEAIQPYHKPSPQLICQRLAESKWSTPQTPTSTVTTSSLVTNKSETGKTGLVNLGNTCYMNSILQALYMCDRRATMVASVSPQQRLLVKLQYVFAHLAKTQRAAYSPVAFLKASRPPWFQPHSQNDCSEFMKYMLDQIHEQELSMLRAKQSVASKAMETPSRVHSPSNGKGEGQEETSTMVQQAFGGQMRTTYRCLRCQWTSSRVEDFYDLPLAFPSQEAYPSDQTVPAVKSKGVEGGHPVSLRLEDMINYYLKPELLQGENRYQCEQCGTLQEAERSLHVTATPDCLILTLLRFAYDVKTHTRSKIMSDVRCPRTIRLPVAASETTKPPILRRDTYCLCTAVMHSGLSSDSGHYYTYARHCEPVGVNGGGQVTGERAADDDYLADDWYLFNDSRVSFTTYESFSSVTRKFSRDTAYVLVYKRIPLEWQRPVPPSAPLDPPLRNDLRTAVERDNMLYLQEQEQEARARAEQQKRASAAPATSWYHNWRDDDSNPPGNCGGGAGGGLDMSGSRFIF